MESRQRRAKTAREQFPEIADFVDEVIATAVERGIPEAQARKDIHVRWAMREDGTEVGNTPEWRREYARKFWDGA